MVLTLAVIHTTAMANVHPGVILAGVSEGLLQVRQVLCDPVYDTLAVDRSTYKERALGLDYEQLCVQLFDLETQHSEIQDQFEEEFECNPLAMMASKEGMDLYNRIRLLVAGMRYLRRHVDQIHPSKFEPRST